jgi:hypothetical protein
MKDILLGHRLRHAMLPKWWQSDGDVVTTQTIKLCREITGLNLERFVKGEDLTKLGTRNESLS